jgi:hypothetical protein
MDKVHPNQNELAWLSELGDSGKEKVTPEHVVHLQWCTHCRNVVSDYRWLQNEVTSTLAMAANAARVPRPRWWEIENSLLVAARRGTRGWRLSAVASVVLLVCLMLSDWPLQRSISAAQSLRALSPEVALATAPLLDTVEELDARVDSELSSVVTATPSSLTACEPTPLPTPALALPPTPALPEA